MSMATTTWLRGVLLDLDTCIETSGIRHDQMEASDNCQYITFCWYFHHDSTL